MTITGKNLIGGQWSAEGTVGFNAYNPLTAEYLHEIFYPATNAEAHKALSLAKRSFPIFASLAPSRRAAFLRAIGEELMQLGDTLLQRAHVETGLPLDRLQNERARTIKQLTQFAELLEDGSWVQATIATKAPASLRKMYRPIGPIAVFGSSNFPFAYSVAGVDTGPAFAAGCPVVVKAHSAHPGVSELTAAAILKAAQKTNMPDGIFSLLFDDEKHTIAELVVQHSAIKAVAFTGSESGGMALYQLASKRPDPIPVYAEMGSSNPIVLLPEAQKQNPEVLSRTLVSSITTNGGQFCTKPGLLFVVNSPSSASFIDSLKNELEKVAPQTLLTKGIYQSYTKLTSKALALPQVKTLVSSKTVASQPNDAVPLLLQTDVTTFLEHPDLANEIFGPYSLVILCEDMSELKQAIDKLKGQLTASIYLDPSEWEESASVIMLLQEIAGRVIINGVPTGVEVSTSMHHGGPFPATSHSFFSSVGKDAILRFVRPQTFQNWPEELLPGELQDSNPFKIMRKVDDVWTNEAISYPATDLMKS